ncbi:hypothetical protein [Mucilaginibacter psychrotolerans]|uniref:Uncharacterized protein n=1 Tax=Mucilaginibacter psychrotolerans TaxID=1524096 RepID=A0A4Y8S4V2_9SPHI|nr:hypothetical protein [Mucilaginibacter psychrotolerans]TFF33464.1 hypothetical protein E2R66_25610 [Mucilaginibacter psychrotolerans]
MRIIHPQPYVPINAQFFKEPVTIKLRAADFKGVAVIPGQMAVSFQFCFFPDLFIENDDDIDFEEVSLSFQNCFVMNLKVENIKSKNISLRLHGCVFAGRISAPELMVVSLNNCLLKYGITLLNLQKVELSYTTENIFPYWWKQLFYQLNIKDLKSFLTEEQRYQLHNIGQVLIRSSRKDTDKPGFYRFPNNTLPEYKFGYKLSNEEYALLKVSIHIEFPTDETDKNTQIENVSLHSLALVGNPGGKVTIENVHVGNWYLSEFSPKDGASFYNIDPRKPHNEETKIGIHRCNLDKVWFDNVYFGDFDRLSFYRSKFSNAIFTSCSFPEDYAAYEKFLPIENIHYPEKQTANHHKDQYEIFLQLKKALEATGNIYEALKLQAISQMALHKITTIGGGDKFILWTNRVSNDHGLSIRKPFIWFLRITIPGYLLYLLCAGLLFQPTKFDPDLIGYYFSFIDLTHKIDFLKEKNGDLNALSLTLDYVAKLFVGYIIFQFVVAFRKYGKKS